MFIVILASAALAAQVAAAPPQTAARTRVVRTLDRTIAAQPIELPGGPVRVTVSEVDIPAGGRLPPHRHPYARYVHVLAGRLAVRDLATGAVAELAAGDWAVDVVETLHEGQALGAAPVRLLLIEQAPAGAPTTRIEDDPGALGACPASGFAASGPPPVDCELEGDGRSWR
jgi:quercetin dioxygenase-like cupin family protein